MLVNSNFVLTKISHSFLANSMFKINIRNVSRSLSGKSNSVKRKAHIRRYLSHFRFPQDHPLSVTLLIRCSEAQTVGGFTSDLTLRARKLKKHVTGKTGEPGVSLVFRSSLRGTFQCEPSRAPPQDALIKGIGSPRDNEPRNGL